MTVKHVFSVIVATTALFYLAACNAFYHASSPDKPDRFRLVSIFPSDKLPSITFGSSMMASPVQHVLNGQTRIIVPVSDGTIAALDADTGDLLWQLKVPTSEGQQGQLVASPVVVDDLLVVVYQNLADGMRVGHHLAVLDLANNQWHGGFPVLTVAAEQATSDGKDVVKFNPPNAYSHAALKHWRPNAKQQGYVYASFGNAADVQPFHGWLFEVDLDAWRQQNSQQAIKNILLTTPETYCPKKMEYGTQEMICGGGIWGPAGPLLETSGDEAELFVATGNGQVDLKRDDYANSLLRIRPGQAFDPGCDRQLCADFNPLNPSPLCLASCKNLFIPRLMAGDPPLKPPNHECDNRDFWECLAWMDYDLGANSPVKVKLGDGRSVLVQPGKDGAAYLVDAGHLGTQYDRLQIAPLCGSPTDLCKLSWAGMIVTQPLQTVVDDEPVVIIPSFSPDNTHPAGVVAIKIVMVNGQPKLKPFWRFPEEGHPDALKMFRSHPSFPVLTTQLGRQQDAVVWLVDIGGNGTLYGIRAKDGQWVAKQSLKGSGRQLSFPLIIGDKIYLASIMPNTGKAFIEAYRIEQAE